MELFKRLFSGITIVALALITVAPAGFAHAATLSGGDLIKASGAAVYYYGNDGKRYVFPNENTFKTWYGDFSSVKTITDSELAAISIGGNVVFRPGTYLVKITTDPKVYAVSTNKTLHWVKSEAAAKTLWGNDWAKWVKDVPDAYFTNYNDSTTVIDGTMHPAGSLIKYNGSDKVYYVDKDGKKREFTGSSFSMNGFMTKFVVTSPDSITYPNGAEISGKESMLWDAAQKSGTTPAPAPAPAPGTGDGMLSVQLASDTPAASDVPAGATAARNITFTKLNFSAGNGDVKITKLKIKREGLSSDTDLSNVKLFDSANNQLGTNQNFDAEHVASFIIDWTVKAGETKSLFVKGDSAASKTGRIKLGLVSAEGVTSNAKSVSGTFPIFGNSITQVNVSVGSLSVSRGPSDPTVTTANIDDKAFRFIQVRLTAGSTEAVNVSAIALRDGNSGSINTNDLANVYLMDDTNGKKYTGTRSGDRYTFTFSPAIKLEKGRHADFSLHGDVISGSAKVAQFDLIDNSDWLLWANGEQYGYGVSISPDAGSINIDFDSSTSGDQSASEPVTVSQGSLTVSKGPNNPAAGNIPVGGDDVKIASFLFEARGEDIRVGQTVITLTETSGFDADVDASLYKLVDKNGKVWAGPQDASGTTVTFSTQMIFPLGPTELFVTAKIASSGLTSGVDKISAGLATPATKLTNAKGMTSNKSVTAAPAANVNGNTMTAKSAALTLSMGGTPIIGTQIIGARQAHLASIRFDATSGGEDVKVTSLTLTAGGTFAGSDVNEFSNYKLWDGSTQIGETEQHSTAGGSATGNIVFNIDKGFIVPKNSVKELLLTADAIAIDNSDTTTFDANTASGVGVSSGVAVTGTQSPTTDSPTQTWSTVGQLKVTLDGSNPTKQVISSSMTGLEVVRYKFRASYEDMDITELNLYAGATGTDTSPASAATKVAGNVSKVKLYLGSDLLAETQFNTSGLATVNLDAGKFRVAKDHDLILKVVVDLAHKSVVASATGFYIGLQDDDGDGSTWGAAGSFNMSANGVASGTSLTETNIDSVGDGSGNANGGNRFNLYDGLLTVSLSPNSPSGKFVQGSNVEVLRLDLKATGDEIGVLEMDFIKGGSCTPDATSNSAAYLQSTDGSTIYWTFATGTAWFGGDLETDSATDGTTLTIGEGETKTVVLKGNTVKSTPCTTGTTFQYSVSADLTDDGASDDISNGVQWYDQELTLSTPVTIPAFTGGDTASPNVKFLPVNGNVLEV